jgi:hypothetical protein
MLELLPLFYLVVGAVPTVWLVELFLWLVNMFL